METNSTPPTAEKETKVTKFVNFLKSIGVHFTETTAPETVTVPAAETTAPEMVIVPAPETTNEKRLKIARIYSNQLLRDKALRAFDRENK